MATAIGLFDRLQDAERAVEALVDRGLGKDEINIIAREHAGLVSALANMGVPGDDAHIYAEGVSRGGALVTVQASDARKAGAQDLLTAAGAVNIRDRRTEWRRHAATYPDQAAPGTQQLVPEEAAPQSDARHSDALLDIEVDKGGT